MAADDSDSSSLSSAPEEEVRKLAPIFMKAKKATKLVAPPPVVSPPRPKRPPSPPHEEVLADNPDIAFLVMFRSRFAAAFSSKFPHFGPQDIERGVVDTKPSELVEGLMCATLGLVLNRKKPVERGHHGRALEEAMASHRAQWPLKWNAVNPLSGGKDFNSMSPSERLNLLRTLALWSLSSSDTVNLIVKDSYKQQRHNDDENQALSVQPWGMDGDKRRYFLIEGQDDTAFRIYRESSRHTRNAAWWSVAGDIEDVKKLAEKLESKEYDGSQAARRLAGRMLAAIPRFEGSEEKRRKREYRQMQRARFSRPEPGFSLYEGRTRGKRARYTFDDEDVDDMLDDSDAASLGYRRSARHTGSARSTPAAEAGPTYTASGRQVKPRHAGEYGASLLSTQAPQTAYDTDELGHEYSSTRPASDEDSEPVRPGGRSMRSAGRKRKRQHIDGYNSIDAMSDEDEESGGEWDSDVNDNADDDVADADAESMGSDERSDSEEEEEDEESETPKSLMVKLKISPSSVLASTPDYPGDRPKVEEEGPCEHPSENDTNSSFVQTNLSSIADIADVSMTDASTAPTTSTTQEASPAMPPGVDGVRVPHRGDTPPLSGVPYFKTAHFGGPAMYTEVLPSAEGEDFVSAE